MLESELKKAKQKSGARWSNEYTSRMQAAFTPKLSMPALLPLAHCPATARPFQTPSSREYIGCHIPPDRPRLPAARRPLAFDRTQPTPPACASPAHPPLLAPPVRPLRPTA